MVKRDSALSDAELGAKLRAVGNVAVPYVLLEEMSKLESELAELRKDRERLNFLESDIELYRRKGIVIRLHTKGGLGLSTASSLREALDDLGAVPDTAPPEDS